MVDQSIWGSGNSLCTFEGVSQVSLEELGNVSIPNCSCDLSKLNAAISTNALSLLDGIMPTMAIAQGNSNNAGVGVYIYDSNSVALGVGLTFGLFVPLILCAVGVAADYNTNCVS